MSRYEVSVGRKRFAYGYDRPLSEYFLTQMAPKIREIVGSVGGQYGSAMNLLTAAESLGIALPDDQRQLLMLDLPI